MIVKPDVGAKRCQKIPYTSRADALTAIRDVQKHGKANKAGTKGLEPYECNRGCDAWHIGHTRRRVLHGRSETR